MLLETMTQQFRVAIPAGNSNASSFTALVPTVTEPVAGANGVWDLCDRNGIAGQNSCLVVPYGTGSDANTLSVRVCGWRAVGLAGVQGGTRALWIPVVLCELVATLDGSSPGIAGSAVPGTMLFAKTLSLTTGNANVSVELVSPAAAGEIAHFLLVTKGFQKLQFQFSTGSSATDGNAVFAQL